MDVLEIAPGLWRWTAYHEEWKEDVGCVYVETEDGVVLIDPLVPPEDTAKFWKALDRDVKRHKGPVHVLITVFWHARSAAAMRERFDARIWGPSSGKSAIARRTGVVTDTFAPGDPLPGGLEAYRTARAAEVVYWVSEHSALVPGDVLARRRQGWREDVPGVVAARVEVAPRPRRLAPSAARPPGPSRPRLARAAGADRRRSRSRARARALEGGNGSNRLRNGLRRGNFYTRRAVLWLWIVLGLVVLLLIFAALGYNRLVRLRNEATTGWSNIDVQLQRRTDLIPNLVEAVRGYAAHERGVFEEVTKARAALQQAATPAAAGQANDVLTGALGRLFAVAEAYPELRASENFLRLQDELTDTEDKISAARRYYNSTVMHYNNGIQSLPWVVVARPLGFREKEFFSAEGDTAPPQVSFTPAT